MTEPTGEIVEVPSKGWRTVWIGRLIVAGVAAFVLFGAFWLGMFPMNLGTQFFLVSSGLFLALLTIVLESVRPRAVAVSTGGVVVKYLFSKTILTWDNVRRSAEPKIPGLKDVAYDQIPPQGIGGRAFHWVTAEQSEAIERYRHSRGSG